MQELCQGFFKGCAMWQPCFFFKVESRWYGPMGRLTCTNLLLCVYYIDLFYIHIHRKRGEKVQAGMIGTAPQLK